MKLITLLVQTFFCLLLILSDVAVAGVAVDHHGERFTPGENPDDCIACHDNNAERNHHPILIHYPPAGNDVTFAPLDTLQAKNLQLFNEQIVCVTCHDLHNSNRGHLAIENKNSELCLICHLK